MAVPPFVIAKDSTAIINTRRFEGKDGTSDSLQVFTTDKFNQGWTSENAEKSDFILNDGTKGTRYYTKHTNVGEEGLGPVENEEGYEYFFEKNGTYLHAVYTILPGTESQLDNVEKVLKTLKFN